MSDNKNLKKFRELQKKKEKMEKDLQILSSEIENQQNLCSEQLKAEWTKELADKISKVEELKSVVVNAIDRLTNLSENLGIPVDLWPVLKISYCPSSYSDKKKEFLGGTSSHDFNDIYDEMIQDQTIFSYNSGWDFSSASC